MAGESADAAARRMRAKAERLTRTAEQWERGAEGERLVGTLLEVLPPQEWTVFHDLRWPGRQRANIDHVAVGPTGIFVIDAKNWGGTVEFRDGVLRQDGHLRQPTVNAASDAARAVARVTTSTSPLHVQAVLCFVTDQVVTGRSGDVVLCSTANLHATLQSRPPILTQATRARVCRDIDAYMRPATPGRPTPRVAASARPVPAAQATSRRVSRGVAALVSLVLGVTGLAVFVTSGAPGRIGELLTSVVEADDPGEDPGKSDRPGKQRGKKPAERDRRGTR